MTFAELREWSEMAGHVGDVTVAIAALFGLQQIRLLKTDMRLRNQRAASEKAMEAVTKYADFAALAAVFFNDLHTANLETYKGPIGDFSPASVPAEWEDLAKKRVAIQSWIPAINSLDTVAATFVYGVAAEDTGFDMIGRSYCANVGHFYDLIARYRKDEVQPHFQAIVKLYGIWANRLSKAQLQVARSALDAQIGKLPDTKITAIGTDEYR